MLDAVPTDDYELAALPLKLVQADGYAADQMGHSIEMFSKSYARWITGRHNVIERNKLNALIASNLTRVTPTAYSS